MLRKQESGGIGNLQEAVKRIILWFFCSCQLGHHNFLVTKAEQVVLFHHFKRLKKLALKAFIFIQQTLIRHLLQMRGHLTENREEELIISYGIIDLMSDFWRCLLEIILIIHQWIKALSAVCEVHISQTRF